MLALTACATLPPPTAELAAAQQAVARAGDADAEQYAPDEYAQARSALEQAQAAMAAGNGHQADARGLALLASANADLANARSRAAVADNDLAQRRAEIANLKKRLRMEDGQ